MSPALTLLDAVRLRRDDGTVVDVEVATTKALDLLRLVAGAGERSYGADHYIAQLWPRADDAKGRTSLRTALAQLRRALGPDVVRRVGDALELGIDDTDVGRLRDGAARVERMSGRDAELLDLVLAVDADCGTELVVAGGSCGAVHALREELLEVRCRLMLDGAAAAYRLGRPRVALDLARRADVLVGSEASARMLMLAWSAMGETRRAIETFERLQASLHSSYGVPPAAETRAVYLQVVTGADAPRARRVQHHEPQVTELADLLQELSASPTGGVVWMLGEPGAGRGSVAREAVRRLEQELGPDAGAVMILPEVVGFDDAERARLRAEAASSGDVLVVPVRGALRLPLGPHERAVTVDPLPRREFRRLLAQLLQQVPSRALEERLWTTTGGLAGHAVRTVGTMLRHDTLRWWGGQVDVASVTRSR